MVIRMIRAAFKTAKMVEGPSAQSEDSKDRVQKQGGKNSTWFQSRIDHIHAPCRSGVHGSCFLQPDSIPHPRLIHNLLNSAVKKLRHVHNAAAVADPCPQG